MRVLLLRIGGAFLCKNAFLCKKRHFCATRGVCVMHSNCTETAQLAWPGSKTIERHSTREMFHVEHCEGWNDVG